MDIIFIDKDGTQKDVKLEELSLAKQNAIQNYLKENLQKTEIIKIDYENNINCINCKDCHDCKNCKDCKYCYGCENCTGCRDCDDCKDCKNCKNCYACNNCRHCEDCKDCEIMSFAIGKEKKDD